MRSLVLDQSTTTVGAAVVEEDSTATIYPGFTGRLIWDGRLITPSKTPLVDRLSIIKADIQQLITAFKPDELVVENTTFIKQRSGNTSNALGAIYIACQELASANRIAFYSQNPSTIKKVLTGHGDADKEAVIKAVCQYFGIPRHKILDDNHGDALGAAFVWLYRGEEVRAAKVAKWGQKT
jgi:Holliday junction resolvasome RuvABC endonuclease subunit